MLSSCVWYIRNYYRDFNPFLPTVRNYYRDSRYSRNTIEKNEGTRTRICRGKLCMQTYHKYDQSGSKYWPPSNPPYMTAIWNRGVEGDRCQAGGRPMTGVHEQYRSIMLQFSATTTDLNIIMNRWWFDVLAHHRKVFCIHIPRNKWL